MIYGTIALIAIALLIASAFVYTWRLQYREWNNGHCPDCGARWVKGAEDSHGARHYSCPSPGCSQGIWIDWRVDR